MKKPCVYCGRKTSTTIAVVAKSSAHARAPHSPVKTNLKPLCVLTIETYRANLGVQLPLSDGEVADLECAFGVLDLALPAPA